MKALLLRVGIDKGNGGCHAPIFEDGTFEYIPIPESCSTSEEARYNTLRGRFYNSITDLIPARLHSVIPHIDPEFTTFTYGDPTQNKHNALTELTPGDLLVFYSALQPVKGVNEKTIEKADIPRLFIIGYFTVKCVHDFTKMSDSERDLLLNRLKNNAHVKRIPVDQNLVIVEGDPQNSKLFQRAIPVGDSDNCIMKDLQSVIGYEGSILRAVPRKVDSLHSQNLMKYLKDGTSSLINEDTHLFSYVLAVDKGFAPNVTGGYCTLACCKPVIRRVARVGDWVVGTFPKRFGSNRIGYLMRVNEALSFDKYFNDKRFECKKPPHDPTGDNIYYKQNGKFIQLENKHHSAKEIEHDTKTDRVLIGSLFWYFGGKGPSIPSKFGSIIKEGPGHKRIKNTKLIREFISWVSLNYRPYVLGAPRDGGDGKGSSTKSEGC